MNETLEEVLSERLAFPIESSIEPRWGGPACHNVEGGGEFTLLTEKVDTNEKVVPNPDDIPIPCEIDIGE